MENTVDLAHPQCLGKMWTSGPALLPCAFLPVSRGTRVPERFKPLIGSCGAGQQQGTLHPILGSASHPDRVALIFKNK